ncbi:MAG: cytochrome C [SAR86 cluster bacterium]|uniref:Cytochrome C n=1 Tax=SAR86 cluster bacterium TaxID=2030880 RepID=A0A2A4MSP8_9GAMM|nr:MAG: cytochrome C [SAR86 cluster bacterium]
MQHPRSHSFSLKRYLKHYLKPSRILLAASIGLFSCSLFAAADFDPAQVYKASCAACHDTGAAHAPEVGDTIEWEIRLDKGMDQLVQNAIDGLNGVMPPKGLCMDCSDDQLKAIVEYMLENSL